MWCTSAPSHIGRNEFCCMRLFVVNCGFGTIVPGVIVGEPSAIGKFTPGAICCRLQTCFDMRDIHCTSAPSLTARQANTSKL